MDPFTLLGAVAGAIQLLDTSLTHCREIYGFVSEFRHARGDVELLQKTLQEVAGLLGHLNIYATELQQSAHTQPLQATHVHSIDQISRWFAEDLLELLQLLPRNISSVPQRVTFVFKKNPKAKALLQRLEQRKTSAMLFLQITDRLGVDRIATRDNVSTVGADVLRNLTLMQDNLSEHLNRQHTQTQQQDSDILRSLQDLRLTVAQNHAETSNRWDAQEVTAKTTSLIREDVHAARACQHEILSLSQKAEGLLQSQMQELRSFRDSLATSATPAVTNLAADSVDQLALLVRAELHQQLEPFKQWIGGARRIDDIVVAMAAKAKAEHIFQESPQAGSHLSRDRPQDTEISHYSRVARGSDSFSERPMATGRSVSTFKEITLFTFSSSTRTPFGTLSIDLSSYRLRNWDVRAQENSKYFRLKFRFMPGPRLWHFTPGLSAVCSTGPDSRGYFNIFPSLQTFRIYPSDSPAHDVIMDDDLSTFKKMLASGEIGIRDRIDQSGYDLLEVSTLFKATSICSYLLFDLNFGKRFMDRNVESSDWSEWSLVLAGLGLDEDGTERKARTLQVVTSMSEQMEDADGEFGDAWLHWTWKWVRAEFSEPWVPSANVLAHARLLMEYGMVLNPLPPWKKKSLESNVFSWMFRLKIFLATGGNLNEVPRRMEHTPLFNALELVSNWKSLWRERDTAILDSLGMENSDSLGSIDGSESGSQSGWMEQEAEALSQDELYAEILSLFVASGVDIYQLYSNDDPLHLATIMEVAEDLDVLELWKAALERNSLDVVEVAKESERRKIEYRRLHGAIRTGVDVEWVLERGSTSNFRYREKE